MEYAHMNIQTPTSSAGETDRVVFDDDDPPPLSRIKDPIHQYMPLTPYMREVIDTPQFQRLRHLKQLGTTYYVWPGASHNRFEHSLGVAHLAREMVEHLRECQKGLKITDRDVKCVTLAGLLHDLGHGPFSHVWDGQFIPRAIPGSTWVHEEGSKKMIRHLFESNNIPIPENDLKFILDLVKGEVQETVNLNEKKFLFEIVANKRNGIDVDKFDYIARDTHAIGDNSNIASLRLIQSARVIGEQICYGHKDRHSVYRLFQTRLDLHRQYYHHPTAKALELMVVDALLLADPFLQISCRINDAEQFTYLTDSILQEIEASRDPNLAPARAVAKRICKRDLYKSVDFNYHDWDQYQLLQEKITAKAIVEVAHELYVPAPGEVPLKEADVIVDFSKIHSGKGNENPMNFVKFYGKYDRNNCHPFTPESGMFAMPDKFGEVLVRVFSRNGMQHFGLIQNAYRELCARVVPAPPQPPAPKKEEEVVADPAETEDDTPVGMKTPQPASRTASLTSIGSSVSGGGNMFTAVPIGFVPPESPARSVKSNRVKRGNDEVDRKKTVEPETPVKKRRLRKS